ncbi:MAG TPA: hypothetical protein VK131_12265 [Candidatus Acidoferrales bacterium]|nr:hypothetical protein [Candidatus Acidoferrales bacterium]
MLSALSDLARLRADDGRGLYASAGELFSDAIFGRDSVASAENLLHLLPAISRNLILTLAGLQGTVEAPVGPGSNEEEPGKIHHEHRSLYVGGRRISPTSERLLQQLSAVWGGDGRTLTYYGSADATPIYVRLVCHYCERYGKSLLSEPVIRRDGATTTVGDSVRAALHWTTRNLDGSSVGLVEFLRRNPAGIPFQVWKDSGTSYLHQDGMIANWDAPIAAVEVQGYAYDALLGASRVFEERHWRERAGELRERLFDQLWMPEREYFAMGLDRDAAGLPRRIDSIASNAALLLDTELFDGLPDADRYLRGVVVRICGPEFVTEAGVRCRSLNEADLADFQDYHGAWAVWMKETFEVVRGLYRQGLPGLAHQLGARILNAVNVAGANVEFLYVSPDQRVMYDFRSADPRSSNSEVIAGTNLPEEAQGWTVTAALPLKWLQGSGRGWWPALPKRGDLEAELMSRVPGVEILTRRAGLQAGYARRGDFVVDRRLGVERDQAARARRRTRL